MPLGDEEPGRSWTDPLASRQTPPWRPALEYFNLGPAIVRERPLPLLEYAGYVATVLANALLYTVIALLFGLILFEDRDLA